jgi:hypothetical protein
MREHIILCLERGEFSKFPQETICKTPGLKYKIIQIGCNCSCNIPDWVYKMIECDFKVGRKRCNVWKHSKCASVPALYDEWICSELVRE